MTVGFFPWIYDVVMGAAERGVVGRWRRMLLRPAAGQILEIGAGTGLGFAYYSARATVVAIDPSLAMLQRARERVAAAEATIMLVAADADLLPFRDDTFDESVVELAMCTIKHPAGALAEMRRVMRPGAALRMLEHVRLEQPVVGWLQDRLTPLWRRVAGGCRLNRRTVNLVAAAGFTLGTVDRALGGYVVTILASKPAPRRGD